MEQVLAGRYELQAEIGRGAIGTVWRARDRSTGEPVAVKVLLPETAHDADVVKSLLDEAEILNQLDHPGVVRPRDFVANGLRALVMDLVEGEDVRKRLRTTGPLRPAEVAEIGAQIADALASVHAAGILHGDVKPGNIMVPADGGHAKLVDFGVARRIQLPDTVTHATPEYVAPEVVAGQKPTPASDVYSLGMVLYEMTCGRSPYRGGSVTEVVERHATCVPVQPAGMPDELWAQVLRCVEVDPTKRPSASELAAELRTLAPQLVGRPAAVTIPDYATTFRPRLMEPRDEAPTPKPGEPLWPEAGPVSPAGSGSPHSASNAASTGVAPGGGQPANASTANGQPVSAAPADVGQPVSASPAGAPVSASPAGAPVSAGPLAGSPVSPGPSSAGASDGSVLSLFDSAQPDPAGAGTDRGAPPSPTQVIGAAAIPPEREAGGRGKMVAFVGVAAALVLFLLLGAVALLYSSQESPEPAAKDPAPAETSEKPEPEPSSSGSPSPSRTPSESPTQPAPPTDGGNNGSDGGGNPGGGDGGNNGGDNGGNNGGSGGRPGLGDPMPTMPGN